MFPGLSRLEFRNVLFRSCAEVNSKQYTRIVWSIPLSLSIQIVDSEVGLCKENAELEQKRERGLHKMDHYESHDVTQTYWSRSNRCYLQCTFEYRRTLML